MSPRLGEMMLASQSDERLVKLARGGHERAFAVIVERYRPELSALARRLSPDGKAEDIVQQAFLSAFAALRSGADVKHLRGWLYRIVRNAAARSHAPLCMPLDGSTASVESVEDVVQQRVLAMDALEELGRLPTRQRQAMVGTALHGRGRAEVASSMGVSEGAVRQLVHRARVRIRTAVTAVTPWPLMKWLTAARPGSGGAANVAAGAGVASSGGLVVKLGIVLASGAIATGVASVDNDGGAQRPDRAGPRDAALVSHPEAARDDQVLLVAAVVRAPVRADRSHGSGTSGPDAAAAPSVRARRGGDEGTSQPGRHRQDSGPGSGRPSGGDGRRSGAGGVAGPRPGGGAGSGWSDGAGSRHGGGAGSRGTGPAESGGRGDAASGWGGGTGSGGRGEAGSGWGGAAGLGVGDYAGSRDGGGSWGGGSGGDARSFAGPQAVMASAGGATGASDRGSYSGPGDTRSGAAFGPGSGSSSGPGYGSGPGSGYGSASGYGSGASGPGSGFGLSPSSGAGPGFGATSGSGSGEVGSVSGTSGSSPAGGGFGG